MGKLRLNSLQLARLKSFASRGVDEAAVISAILDGIKVLDFTVGAEATNVINVAAQVRDLDGSAVAGPLNVRVVSIPIAGAGTMAIGTDGTAKAGSASTDLWLETEPDGSFDIDVTNIVAEENLLVFMLDDGLIETVKLTFA